MHPWTKLHTPCSSVVRYGCASNVRGSGQFSSSRSLTTKKLSFSPAPPEPQILVKAQRALSVEMKTEELAGVQRMGDFVSRVEPSQGGVSQLRNDADTVWVF